MQERRKIPAIHQATAPARADYKVVLVAMVIDKYRMGSQSEVNAKVKCWHECQHDQQ